MQLAGPQWNTPTPSWHTLPGGGAASGADLTREIQKLNFIRELENLQAKPKRWNPFNRLGMLGIRMYQWFTRNVKATSKLWHNKVMAGSDCIYYEESKSHNHDRYGLNAGVSCSEFGWTA